MPNYDGAASLEAVAMRATALNPDGSISSGNLLYTTSAFTKVTMTPQMETGDDLVTKNAAGDICVAYKHGDMVKYYQIEVDLCAPDEYLEQMLAGGVLLTDSSPAILPPTTVTAAMANTGGTLNGSVQYGVTAVGRYGETTISTLSTAVSATGSTGAATVTWTAPTAGTVTAYRVYRVSGSRMALVGQVAAGTTSFLDVGAAPLGGAAPAVNQTAGPGVVGVAAPAMNVVGNPNGVSLEVWTKAIVNGNPATGYGGGYRRWVLPWVRNLIRDATTLDSAITVSAFKGEGYGNPSWGAGPVGDWPFGSQQVVQRAREATFPPAMSGPSYVP